MRLIIRDDGLTSKNNHIHIHTVQTHIDLRPPFPLLRAFQRLYIYLPQTYFLQSFVDSNCVLLIWGLFNPSISGDQSTRRQIQLIIYT